MLNKQKGNMYGFVTHTWNAIKGKCIHDCVYCYMKRFPQKELWFDEKELKTDLGKGNFIFIGSSTDMFAENVPNSWIYTVLRKCNEHPENKYLFQSKNPSRMLLFRDYFPETANCMWATTIETNRAFFPSISKAPLPIERTTLKLFPNRMVTIEPIIDFDLDEMLFIIKDISPKWVNIGADSNSKHTLPEPSKEKVLKLIEGLKRFTEVKNKENLARLLN